MSLTITVKRVKGKLYVYDQARVGGKVETIYIGPLEEMARVYQVYKMLGKVEKLSKRDLRRLAKMIAEEYVKKLEKQVVNLMREWRRGRDLNPRGAMPHRLSRPAMNISDETQNPSSVNYTLPSPPVDNHLLQRFREWLLRQVSEETARDYASVVERGIWPPVKRSHVKAWRKYVEFLASQSIIDYIKKMSYLDALKLDSTKQSRTQAKISDSLVISIRDKLEELGLRQLFILGLGGARLSHIVEMLNDYNPGEIVRHPTNRYEARLYCTQSFCRYYLGIQKGRKRCDYIYYPNGIQISKQQINYRRLKDKLHHYGVEFKIMRKWVEQQLTSLAHEHNIPLDAVKLILTRELSVSGIHYLNTRDWADKLFSLYIQRLRENILAEVVG